MADTFRRSRIIDLLKRFIWKREVLKMEINDEGFDGIKEILQGEMQGYDMAIKEIIKEFDIKKDELK